MATKKIPAPGYVTTKPLYPSLGQMKEEVGFQDAAIQLGELASQFLYERAKDAPAGVGPFLKHEFKHRSIPHGTIDFSHLTRFSHRSFIVQTYVLIEKTLRQLAREYRAHKWLDDAWRSSDNGDALSPVGLILKNLPTPEANALKAKPEVDLLEYYRLMRISIVHLTRETLDKVNKNYSQLSEAHKSYFKDTYRLAAPNSAAHVTFDDFLLLTRSFKYISNVFNEACDLRLEDIQAYIKYRDQAVLEILRHPKDKQYSALHAFISANYGLHRLARHFDRTFVAYLRDRGRLIHLLQKANDEDHSATTSIVASRDGVYTIKRSSKGRASQPSQLVENLTLDKAIAHLSSP